MAKGFTITRGRISTGGVIKIVVCSILFIVATIAMLWWEAEVCSGNYSLYHYLWFIELLIICMKSKIFSREEISNF